MGDLYFGLHALSLSFNCSVAFPVIINDSRVNISKKGFIFGPPSKLSACFITASEVKYFSINVTFLPSSEM